MKRHLVSAVTAASIVVTASLAVTASTAPPASATAPPASATAPHADAVTASVPAEPPPLDPAAMTAAISGLPSRTVTGALVKVSGPAGRWSGTAGVGDVATGRPVPLNGNFRIGSASKVFTAVVVLQLAAEHRLSLDRPVQHYLPGLLPASYPAITVRQILDHTSGLPGGTLGAGDAQWFVDHRFDSWTPRQIVADAVSHPMDFAPGTTQEYNGTNYYVAGLLIEKVTGRTYAHEVRRRILDPLRLRDTYVLDRRDPRLPGPHAHGYVAVAPGVLRDVSEQSPYPWAEGGLISSANDLTRLIRAMFQGRLVPRTEFGEMFTVPDVPYADTGNCDIGPEAGRACFSAGGLTKTALPNGVTVWGKTGARPGYTTGLFATRDLRRVLVYSLNATGDKDGSEMPYVVKIAAAAFDPDLAGR